MNKARITRVLLSALFFLILCAVDGTSISSGTDLNCPSIEEDGLYDPKILALYESASNEENIYLDDFYAPTYFMNLRTNFAENAKNSCGYVATGMLLSFWDTYWDGDIIEEKYDQKVLLEGDAFDFSCDSPGLTKEPKSITKVDDATYHSNVFALSDKYFQFLLISMGNSLYGTSPGAYGMAYDNYSRLFDYYVYDYKGYSRDDVEVIKESMDVRKKAIDLIKQGIPVKLGIRGHAVVAYDYDEQNDDIYCHFGWGSNTTHVTIESMGYDSYNNLFAFKFKNGHKHSDNFEYEKEGKRNSLCVCSTVVPTEITLSENYLDACPVFKWNSLIDEKWFRDIDLHHEISILKPDRSEVFTIDNVHANEILLLPTD